MSEEWKDIPGWDGRAQASTLGRIRTLRVLKGTPVAGSNYLSATLEQGRKSYIHALIAATFLGPRPVGMQINHKDFDRQNNRPENLEYCTSQENNRHAFVGRKKLFFTEAQMDQIADWYFNEGLSMREIGRRLGADESDKIKFQSMMNRVHRVVGIWRAASAPVNRRKNPFANVLTDADGERIRELRSQGVTVGEIAKMYGIDDSHASRVSRGLARTGKTPKQPERGWFGRWKSDPEGQEDEE
jgi:hypothetical protein